MVDGEGIWRARPGTTTDEGGGTARSYTNPNLLSSADQKLEAWRQVVQGHLAASLAPSGNEREAVDQNHDNDV